MKILVVDDEALLVKGIRFNLQNEGYDVITGSDGLEAVKAVQEQSPDLVVLDVMMPNMDGLTACAKIREFSEVPIIMLMRRIASRALVFHSAGVLVAVKSTASTLMSSYSSSISRDARARSRTSSVACTQLVASVGNCSRNFSILLYIVVRY